MSRFESVAGPLKGKTFEVTELGSIGRGDTCAVRLEGRHVSRIHALLEKRGDALFIKDNSSRNGVFVNGRKVPEAALRPEDEIEVGEHVLIFDPAPGERKARFASAVVESLTDPFAPGEPDERLPRLLAAAAALAGIESLRDLTRALLDTLMGAVGPERGVVLLVDTAGLFKPAARKTPAGEEEFYVSNVLQHEILAERRAIIATDVRRGEPDAGKPVAILGVPLGSKDAIVGLVYLESRLGADPKILPFLAADLRFAAALAAFAGPRLSHLRRLRSAPQVGAKPLPELVGAFVKDCLAEALRMSKGDLVVAAKVLGLARPDLEHKLKEHGMLSADPRADTWRSVAP